MTNKTRAQAHAYLRKLKGYWWDFDGYMVHNASIWQTNIGTTLLVTLRGLYAKRYTICKQL